MTAPTGAGEQLFGLAVTVSHMASFLIAYGTGEGQTAAVAARITDALRARGHQATAVDLGEAATVPDVGQYDGVLVGASVHAGSHQASVREFVADAREALTERPTAFFQVSLSSASEETRERAASYVDAFVEETGWHPDRIGTFGGALRFSEYGFLTRLLVERVARRDFPKADAGEDAEFTDWDAVDAFAADVAAFVEGRLGLSPPESDHADE